MAIGILAAGAGARFGGPKVLAELGGRPIVRRAVDAAMESGLRPVITVVGPGFGSIERVLPAGVDVVTAPAARLGLAHSLRALIRALDGWRQVGAVCVGLGDQPLVGPDAYRNLAASYAAGSSLAVATYAGQRRNPVLIGRNHWPALLRLRGDVGARALMDRFPVLEVACDGTGRPDDVDTLADLARLERELDRDDEDFDGMDR